MKSIRCVLALSVAALCLSATSYAQEQKFADLGDFRLVSGETLRNTRIGYRTFGKINADRSNIVVFPTWAGGTTEQLKDNVGAGKLISDTDYYVILIDALANGVSSSPSNSKDQPHMKFPQITVRDMINTQHELVTKTLGISHVKAVMGISMGGMQTFQWMVSYPDFMDKAIPMVGSPHVAPYDVVMWRINIDGIKDSAGWNNGDYKENPAGLVHFEIGELVLQTPAEYNRTHTREKVLEALKKAETVPDAEDANNTIRQSEAMIALDVRRFRWIDGKRRGERESESLRCGRQTGSHGYSSACARFCCIAARTSARTRVRLRPSCDRMRGTEASRSRSRLPSPINGCPHLHSVPASFHVDSEQCPNPQTAPKSPTAQAAARRHRPLLRTKKHSSRSSAPA